MRSFQLFKICQGLICDPRCDISWRMFHLHLRRMYIMLLWDKRFYKYKLNLFSSVSFKACISLLILCLNDHSLDVTGVSKSPTIIVLLLNSPFMAVSSCHMLRCLHDRCIYIYNCCIFLV